MVGVDWRTPLDQARRRIAAGAPDRPVAVQGNLDPAVCLSGWPVVEAKTREVLAANGDQPGHVFNLGHGVLPETDPGVLEQVVALVHDTTAR
jgi:uroporphyrinogen decarboxylase